jgi:predicted nucleic acid-binding protein
MQAMAGEVRQMWVATLNIVTLALMLAVLGYVAFAARRLEASLGTLLDDQVERLRRIERDLDRVRQALDSVSTGVTAIDIRQRLRKN